MSENILKNPELKGFTTFREFVDNSGNKGWMEHPNEWEYVWTPMHDDDPNRVPQSLHRDKGYCIAAGWRVWEAGYVQRRVPVMGGQRYLLKAVFRPDVNFSGGHEPDLEAIQWRFWVDSGRGAAETGWYKTSKWQYKQIEEQTFVVEPQQDMMLDVYFMARSNWANNACDFNIFSITMEKVPVDFGSPTYIKSGNPISGPPLSPPPAAPEPEPAPPVAPPLPVFNPPQQPAPPVPAPTGPTADSPVGILEIMSDDDLAVIAQGFREAASTTMFGDTIAAGFSRWADVLERYRAQRR